MDYYSIPISSGRKARVYKHQEEGVVRDYLNKVPFKDVMKNNHASSGVVKHILEKHGVSNQRRPDYSKLPKQEIIVDYLAKVSISDLIKKYSCSKDAIYDILHAEKVESPHILKEGNEIDLKICQLYREGYGVSYISSVVDKSLQVIYGSLRRANIPRINKYTIFPEDYPDIIDRYQNGESSESIAKDYDTAGCVIRHHLEKAGVDRRKQTEAHTLYPINSNFFDNINNQRAAYMLGFYWADGCNKTYDSTVQMILNSKDIEILEKFKTFLGHETKPIRIFNAENPSGKIGEYADYCIYNKHISETLNSIGMVKRKTYADILDFPLGLKKEFYKDFIRGLFDGDGGISNYMERNYERIRISIAGHSFLLEKIKKYFDEDVSEFTCSIVDASLINPDICKTRVLVVSGNQNSIRFLHWIYKDRNDCFLKRKHDLYQYCVRRYFEKINQPKMAGMNYVN